MTALSRFGRSNHLLGGGKNGNISLGVLPGGGDKASSTSGRSDILFCRLDRGSGVSFRQSSLMRLVDERDELRNDLLRRLLH
jgi:hypothetical protein